MLRRRGSRLSAPGAAAPLAAREARRIARLHAELVDELVPLPVDGPGGPALLAELFYALHPPIHEGRVPTFGAVVSLGTPHATAAASSLLDGRADVEVVGEALGPAMQRRAADGCSTFVWRTPHGPEGVIALARSHEDEADLVTLRERLGEVVVVQRDRDGRVRVVTEDGVVIWNLVDWVFKPVAQGHLRLLARLLPEAEPHVLAELLDLCVHRLSAQGTGATLVWWLDDGEPTGLDRSTAREACSLSVADPRHHPALLSILSQQDRAVVLRRSGELTAVDVALLSSAEAEAMTAPWGGTRHSSARRYSFDQPRSVVFVVSEDGPVSVFSDGASVAQVRVDPCRVGVTADRYGVAEGGRVLTCPTCTRHLLVDVVDLPAWTGGPEHLSCPVCDGPIVVDAYRAAIRGPIKLPADEGLRATG